MSHIDRIKRRNNGAWGCHARQVKDNVSFVPRANKSQTHSQNHHNPSSIAQYIKSLTYIFIRKDNEFRNTFPELLTRGYRKCIASIRVNLIAMQIAAACALRDVVFNPFFVKSE